MRPADLPESAVKTEGLDTERPVSSIPMSVAALTNQKVFDMEPLHDYVDCDALQAIVQSSGFTCLRFDYAGYDVAVSEDGTVAVIGVKR